MRMEILGRQIFDIPPQTVNVAILVIAAVAVIGYYWNHYRNRG